ncbi:MAG: serine protein kinase RIO [Chloroflexi bacterium]|nr:serine protein kinase RIO [Chloroflexota bacterium]
MPQVAADTPPATEPFLEEGLITSVLHTIKSGKEASAYLCRAHRSLGPRYAVAKVYHERSDRNFNNDTMYQEGREILNARTKRAVAKKTELGRAAQGALWIDHEFEVMSALHYAGCDVPEVFAATEQAILMEYIGAEDAAAPQLQHTQLAPGEAPALLERLLWDIETAMANNVVHGDLSAFNALYRPGRLTIIDFPQAVDPRFNPHARRLLGRDLQNIARYFARHGVALDAGRHADWLWRRWERGEL